MNGLERTAAEPMPLGLGLKPRIGESIGELRARFMSKVAVDAAGCWLWQAHRTPNGYGQLRVGGRWISAHRLAYQLFKGPIPDGLVPDHLCGVKHCANPDHLEAVTPHENWLRGTAPMVALHKAHRCQQGHDVTGPNAMVTQGRVRCRTCQRTYDLRTRAKRKSA
jgi:HNH endonuclease